MATDLIYIDESLPHDRAILSAVGVADDAWAATFAAVKAWRQSLKERFSIKLAAELHAGPMLAGKGRLGPKIVTRYVRSLVFKEALGLLSRFDPESVWIINVSLARGQGFDVQLRAVERLINRIERCLEARDRTGVVFFDQGREQEIRKLLRKLRSHNPIPSKFGGWPEGATKNITAKRILGDPVFVESHRDYLIQMADFVTYALLKHDERAHSARTVKYGLHEAFDILKPVLNTRASYQNEYGIVR